MAIHSNSYKQEHLIGTGLLYRGLVHCHGSKRVSIQADVVLERWLRGLRLTPQAKEEIVTLDLA